MSLVQWPLAVAAGEDPPPVEITARLHRFVPWRRPPRHTVVRRAIALHLAFGTATGALYGVVAPRVQREATGIGYATLLWAAGYFGVIPALGLHRPAHRDDVVKQTGNAAAHIVYGLFLAEGMRLSA